MQSEEVERRLLNWARWRAGGQRGGLGYASVSLGAQTSSARYRESVIPTSAGEAMETDEAVQRLEALLRRVVTRHYADGLSVSAISIEMRCAVSTVYARLDRAHLLLDAAFHEMALARRAERERVEALTASARRTRGF
jgi:DNA-directed RNA polymerase specialized sigma24 family protein